jgi:hypothetical protein
MQAIEYELVELTHRLELPMLEGSIHALTCPYKVLYVVIVEVADCISQGALIS